MRRRTRGARSVGRWLVGAAMILAAAGAGACASLPGVEPSIGDVRAAITAASAEQLELRFEIDVVNPIPATLHAPRIRYVLDVDGRTLASGRQSVGAEFPDAGLGTVVVPVSLAQAELSAACADFGSGGEAEYVFAGTLAVPVLGGTIDLPFRHAGSVSATSTPASSTD